MLEREHRQIVLVRCQAAEVPRPLPERLRTRVALLRLLHITALAAHDRHLADRIAGHDVVTDLLCQLERLHEIRFRAIHGIDVEECESGRVDIAHPIGVECNRLPICCPFLQNGCMIVWAAARGKDARGVIHQVAIRAH